MPVPWRSGTITTGAVRASSASTSSGSSAGQSPGTSNTRSAGVPTTTRRPGTPPPASPASPAFGEGSFERHSALARAAGTEPEVAEVQTLGLDVDTPDDFAALKRALATHGRGAVRTRALLDSLAPAAP